MKGTSLISSPDRTDDKHLRPQSSCHSVRLSIFQQDDAHSSYIIANVLPRVAIGAATVLLYYTTTVHTNFIKSLTARKDF